MKAFPFLFPQLTSLSTAKDRDRPDAREFGDWSRKGPLPDLPGRGGDRRASDRGGFGSDFGGDRGERRERRDFQPEGDGKVRDFGNWERKGPLSPLPQQERGPRDGGRPRTNDGPRPEGFRDRRSSPAAWGEGRPQGSQDGGSRPPRRDFQDRPTVERAPTAADQDSQWRTKMRPDAPAAKSPVPSRDGSAPSSPAPSAALPASRPKLNLAKRTVSEAVDVSSPTTSASGDAKASPFGAARPIDTAAKEREIEEKRLAAIQEKKEAEEHAKEEQKEAARVAKAAAAENAGEKKVEILQRGEGEGATKEGETIETENANGEVTDDKAVKPKEIVRDLKKPAETGAWRRPSGGAPSPRDDTIPRGPRGGRGGRGGGRGRGNHEDGGRGGRQHSNGANRSPALPAQAPSTESTAEVVEDDGWSTVSKPKKNNRGGNAGARPIAS